MGTGDQLRIGTVLAQRYRVVELLSSGGMGAVYRGERLELGRPVAIKFLHALFSADKSFRGRFEREARAMSLLSHPYCVSVIDYGVVDVPYIVMDFVTGRTLRELIDESRLTTERALRIACQMLSGISHAHGRSIIHRDIKPENVMLSEATGLGEHVRIFDFGLAKLLDSTREADFSTAATMIGTPSYMPPEQSFGEEVDHRTDLYSAGVVLFEMLTGKKPFISDDATQLIRMHRSEPPPRLGAADPDVQWSQEIEAVVERALQKTREDRFQSADDFARALTAVPEAPADVGAQFRSTLVGADEATAEIEHEQLRAKPGKPLSRTTIFVLAGAALILLLGAAALAIVLVIADREPPPAVAELAPIEGARAAPAAEPATPDPEPIAAPTLADARQLIAAGNRDEAIKALQQLRVLEPQNAELPFLLGNLFFDKKWHADGVDRYAQALEIDPSYRDNERLIRDLIESLVGDKLRFKTRALLIEKVGSAAQPHLQQAATSHASFKVRRRAAAIIKELE
jgi:serine/threonine-protein kinase